MQLPKKSVHQLVFLLQPKRTTTLGTDLVGELEEVVVEEGEGQGIGHVGERQLVCKHVVVERDIEAKGLHRRGLADLHIGDGFGTGQADF